MNVCPSLIIFRTTVRDKNYAALVRVDLNYAGMKISALLDTNGTRPIFGIVVNENDEITLPMCLVKNADGEVKLIYNQEEVWDVMREGDYLTYENDRNMVVDVEYEIQGPININC